MGQQQVQGIDNAYTLQGWLKGINSVSVGDGTHDIGKDGKAGSLNAIIARDAFGFALHYYQNDAQGYVDYRPIGGTAGYQPFPNPGTLTVGSNTWQLFNGNIAAMALSIPTLGKTMQYKYKYDQLNRLVKTYSYFGLSSNNAWVDTATNNYREDITYDPNGNIRTYKRNGDAARANTGGTGMDNMTYTYKANTNQLDKVVDAATDASSTNYPQYNDIKQGQADGNYQYDAIGNMISDASEGINSIEWTVYGKIKSISKSSGTIEYTYDAAGNRISKTYQGKTTWYVRDASGTVMSTYLTDASINGGALTQSEIHLYGSSRLGIYNVKTNVQSVNNPNAIVTFERANKFFELSNHLGNVLVTISDKKIGVDQNSDGQIDYYNADVVTANDYYPFGMMMAGRKYASGEYRYGFNGMEKTKELGENFYEAEHWEYDSRIGRRWNRDPVVKEWESPYATFGNNPIIYGDPNGDDPEKPKKNGTTEGQQETTSETDYARLHNIPKTTYTTWNWHAGGVSQGFKYNKTTKTNEEVFSKAGWYTSEDYVNLLKPIASALALDMNMYNGAAASSARFNYDKNKAGLEKFVGDGLSANARNHLIASAQKTSSAANFSVSGVVYQSGFNVEDMLGVGLLFKGAVKMLGTIAIKNIVGKEASNAILKNTVDDFVKLFQPTNELDAVKTLYRGTTGSEGKGTLLFLTDNADVAATYIKNGGKVMKYEVSNYALFNLRQRGMLNTLEDIHKIGGKEIRHFTYKFEGSNVRQALNQIAKPN